MALLSAQNLTIAYPGAKRLVFPDFTIEQGETVALVGASGSGKSTFVRRLLGQLPLGAVSQGSLAVTESLGWIPQDVSSAFSPFLKMATQLCDGAQYTLGLTFSEACHLAAVLLDRLGVDPARMREHPHRWSGGMLQRALVVMALMRQPALVVADEPTASLDTESIEKVCDLLRERGSTILLISHDASVRERLAAREVQLG